jgi:hypothetical protein
MFVVALTLVVLVSTSVLLYQYWAGSLLVDDAQAAPDMQVTPDVLVPSNALHIDHAA